MTRINMAYNWIPFLQEITEHSDKIAMEYYRSAQLKSHVKNDMTPVSEADLAIETHIRQLIKDQHPKIVKLSSLNLVFIVMAYQLVYVFFFLIFCVTR